MPFFSNTMFIYCISYNFQSFFHLHFIWPEVIGGGDGGGVDTVGMQVLVVIVCLCMLGKPGHFGSVVECMQHIWASKGLSVFYHNLSLFGLLPKQPPDEK